jgi:hypothetical protein
MAAYVTRDLKITYDDLVMGSTSDYLIDGPFEEKLGVTGATFTWELVISKTTESDYQTAVAALETKAKAVRKLFKVEIGSNTRHSYTHTGSTGFNSNLLVEKLGSDDDTGLSGRFRCSVTIGFPGTNVNADGRQDSSVKLTKGPSGLWVVTATGVYTATTGNSSARAVALAAVPTYILTILPSGSFDQTVLELDVDDADKVANFSTVWKEVFYSETASALDDAGLIDQKLNISVTELAGEFSDPAARAPVELLVAYDVAVDRDTYADLRTVWTSRVYPHLVAQAKRVGRSTSLAVLSAEPGYNLAEHRLAATLRCLAFPSGLLEHSVEVEDDIDHGKVAIPVWDGNPFSRDVHQGPAEHTRTVVTSTTRISGGPSTSAQIGPSLFYPPGGVEGQAAGGLGAVLTYPGEETASSSFIERRKTTRTRNYHLGLSTGSIRLTKTVEIVVSTRADPPEGGTPAREVTGA